MWCSPDTAFGKARQTGPGKFEVAFFGPFYGPYWIVHTESSADDKYATAIVYSCTGLDESLWILSRTPTLDPSGSSYDDLVSLAKSMGIDVDKLELVKTEQNADVCPWPMPDSISQRPSDDSGCSLSITGCSPSSWCSWQPSITDHCFCKLKPTKCDKDMTLLASSGPSGGDDDDITGDAFWNQPWIIAGVAIGGFVAGIAALVVGLRHRRRRPMIDNSNLLADGQTA